jgi:hypothetical protein
MDDDFTEPGLVPRDNDVTPSAPDGPPVEHIPKDRYAMPPESATEWGPADPAGADRYLLPDPDQLAPNYVRNDAPWVGFSGAAGAPPAPSDEPGFTRIVRPRQRGKDTVAWVVTGAFIVTAAWFLPILLAPTSQLGRVGSFVALAAGGIVALAVMWRTWRWANGKD